MRYVTERAAALKEASADASQDLLLLARQAVRRMEREVIEAETAEREREAERRAAEQKARRKDALAREVPPNNLGTN